MRVGMQRAREQFADWRFLHFPARIHHDHALRGLGDHAEIVRDQDHSGAELFLQVEDDVEDLRLDGDVERGGRLVGEQHLRIAGERHRDHHALAHAAGELMRIFLQPLLRLGDAHKLEDFDGAAQRRLLVQAFVQQQRFGDLVADCHHRIERRHRLLEDHRDVLAAHAAHRALVERQEISTVEGDGAGDDLAGRLGD